MLRMEDGAKREVKKTGEEGDWKNKTRYRGGWKRLSDEAVTKLRSTPHPRQRDNEEERDIQLLLLISYTHTFLLEVPT